MVMTDQPTCGQGLAEHSSLPSRIADVIAALAGVLEFHQTALDISDAHTQPEREAYGTLASDFHGIATMLARTAAQMAGERYLPMGRHDESILGGAESMEKFATFVRAERQLLDLLQTSLERDEAMLQNFTRVEPA